MWRYSIDVICSRNKIAEAESAKALCNDNVRTASSIWISWHVSREGAVRVISELDTKTFPKKQNNINNKFVNTIQKYKPG